MRRRGHRWLRWAALGGARVLMIAAGTWSSLAMLYGGRSPAWVLDAGAVVIASIMAACAAALPRRAAVAAALLLTAGVAGWWLSLVPSNDRLWAPEYAVTASATRDADRVTLRQVRNASYGRDGTAVFSYYDADYRADELDEVDLISSYWGGDAVAHVFLSFGFRDGRHVAISVETRREKDEDYSVLAGFFRHYELMYVVADERDLIGVRTDIRHERVYLYRLETTADERRRLFLSYVDRVAGLSGEPEFYDTLFNNCSTNVLQRAEAASGRWEFSWMVLMSGYADRYAYELGRLDRRLPFPELKRRSLIVRASGGSIGPEFSAQIRRGLPG